MVIFVGTPCGSSRVVFAFAAIAAITSTVVPGTEAEIRGTANCGDRETTLLDTEMAPVFAENMAGVGAREQSVV